MTGIPALPTYPVPGRLGKYELQAEIGRGGMGIVYRGYDTRLMRMVAVKVLAPELSVDPEFVQRFRDEAIAAGGLEHPNIVKIYDVGQEGNTHFIVMELLTGASLAGRLQKRGPLSLAQANAVIKQVASALDYAHGRHIVHRDVKPANIMLDPVGHVTLMDFGLARARQSTSGVGAGTPHYMAPEQILGQPVDGRADVYACGALLFCLLAGRPPFDRSEPAAIAYAQVHEPPPSLHKLRPEVSRTAEAVILQALAKQPAERYATPGELAADYEAAISARTPAGLKAAPAAPAKKPPRLLAAGLAIALIAGALGLGWALTRVWPGQAEPSATQATDASAPPPTGSSQVTPSPLAPSPTASVQPVVVPPTALPIVIPTATLVAGSTPLETPLPRTAAPAAQRTSQSLAAPVLVAPEEDETVSGQELFAWEWGGQLEPGEAFEVRIWREGATEHLGAFELITEPAGGRIERLIDVSQAPAVRIGGAGAYLWSVAVVNSNPYLRTGPEAPPRRLYFKPAGASAPWFGTALAFAVPQASRTGGAP